jgi:hypothetical protein
LVEQTGDYATFKFQPLPRRHQSDMAITLLLYPNDGANYLRLVPDSDEEDTLDRYDQFQRHA